MMMKRTALAGLAALALVVVASPCAGADASATASTIIGLIGKSVGETRMAGRELDLALASDSRSFQGIQQVFDQVLERHQQVARDLRTAFALSTTVPGGFYFSTVNEHRRLNDRLGAVLLDGTTELTSADFDRYRKELDSALAIVPGAHQVRE
jgi:hypothetical protein